MNKKNIVRVALVLVLLLVVILAANYAIKNPPVPGKWENAYNLGQNERLLLLEMLVSNQPVEGGALVAVGHLQEEFVYTPDIISGKSATRGNEEVPPEEISWLIVLLPAQGEPEHDRETLRIVGVKGRTLVLKRDNPKLFVPQLEDQYPVVEKYEFNLLKDEFVIASPFTNIQREISFSPRPVHFRGLFSSDLFFLGGNLYSEELGAAVFVRKHEEKIWRYVGDIVAAGQTTGIVVQIAQKSLDDFQEIAYSALP